VSGGLRDATEPPEARGLARDEVRLLVARRGGVEHTSFRALPQALEPGDLVVVNTSATRAAAVDGWRADGRNVVVHFATALDDGTWVVELRPPGRSVGPVGDAAAGERVGLPSGARLELLTAHPDAALQSSRLWRARVAVEGPVTDLLARRGRPVAYAYVPDRWPLESYQTVFALHPGSAEMPSAGRPFSTEVVTGLVSRGVAVAPLALHTALSSPEEGEPPQAERYDVPAATARLVEHTRRHGGRVVAVGTTVTRALETVAGEDGRVLPGAGWTDLVLGPDRPVRVVDGLVTGWHPPGASHRRLLEAVAGPALVEAAYAAAEAEGYRWHEFGDSCLLLP
jgi:S-adenosylmethionine:tRNA ribosyltransferase-isomerase